MLNTRSHITPLKSSKLGTAVRDGRCGTDPRLVPEYIRAETLESSNLSREEQWQTQAEIVGLLFETISDTLLASCWRRWCLQCCCMPLHTLRCLSLTASETGKVKRLEKEMVTLRDYYLKD